MLFRRPVLVPVLLASVVLAGCGGAGDGVFGERDWGKPNATDAAFVRGIIVHKRSVGTIARLGRRKALREELREIAGATLVGHDQDLHELGRFKEALRARRVSPVGAELRGEPPPFDPRGLRTAVSLDHEFLVLMVHQHEYAMATAAVQRDRGGDVRLRLLAEEIHASSRRDLAKLRRWLRTWYGDDTQRGPAPLPSPGGGGGGGPGPGPEV